jgi:hypothetical protein
VERAFLLWLCCLLGLTVAARADIFRCEEADGSVRFADDARGCPGAERLERRPRDEEGRVLAPPTASAQEKGGERTEGRPATDLRLEEILLPAAGLAGRWEVVDEAPGEPAQDPDLLRWGVRAQRTRHYTRSGDAGVQVCSIEVWSFENSSRARLAHENFRYPDWHFERQEHLLIMLHAVTFPRGGSPRREVFGDCLRLGAQTRARAAIRLRR